MATKRGRLDAVAVAQVDTLTPGGTIEVGDKFIVTENGKSVTYTATGTTVASVTAGLQAALAASTIPEFTEKTWADATTHVTATANVAGKPFTITATTTENDGSAADAQTFVRAASVASSGPEDWNVAANWDSSGVPASDDVILENNDNDLLYNLDQNAVTLASLKLLPSYEGDLGLPDEATVSGGVYYEYREKGLKAGITALEVNCNSSLIRINGQGVQSTVNVFGTGSPTMGDYAFYWKGTHASNVVQITRGSMAIAAFAGETAVVATLRVGYQQNKEGDVRLKCGSGVTLTTIEMSGGTVEINSAATTINKTGGRLTTNGTGAITTLRNDEGDAILNSTGTITTLNVGSDGKADFSNDLRPKTVTNCNLYEGGEIYDPHGVVTFTNGIVLVRTDLTKVKINVGVNRTLSVA